MAYEQVNPATGEQLRTWSNHTDEQVDAALEAAVSAWPEWASRSYDGRAEIFRRAAEILRERRDELATIITKEMGKPIAQAEGEVEKCALGCDFYALNAEPFLRPVDKISSATHSYVRFDPLGVVFCIMPWNFPFWQVFRFAAPALMAGNVGLLKHASNVPECAEAIEKVIHDAGVPAGVFKNLYISGQRASELISDPRIAAVTLTGSEGAGREVGAAAGRAIKPSVMELGGSDPFVVLPDADLDATVATAVKARCQNSGQSCIAAKRFVVHTDVAEAFVSRFTEALSALQVGDPSDRATDVGPLARPDLVADLHTQVEASVKAGATVALGGSPVEGPGSFYAPTILTDVGPGMPAYDEELFGPVAAIIVVKDEDEAVRVANDTPYGLGASVWTTDVAKGEAIAAQIQAGNVFVNAMVGSDPRIPFGGVKLSGYGRELSDFGIREFVNIKTVYVK